MRILHTADWHIGRTLLSHDMADDQRFAIEGVTEIARGEKVDAIVIAGDLYDRGNPSEESVAMLDEALERLCEVAPVLAIAGNHDSGPRLEFGRKRQRDSGLHLIGTCAGGVRSIVLQDAHGEVEFHLMPFAMPEQVRHALKDEEKNEEIRSHDVATASRLPTPLDPRRRHVLVGHLFVQGGTVGDTERSIAVGGVEHVDPSRFEGFAYTALGHLHRPHAIGTDRIRYSGSLCRCSFSEEDHAKSVSIVDLDGAGDVAIEEVEIEQRFGMRTIRGTFDELLRHGLADDRRERDWIRVELTDEVPIYNAMTRLREVYPRAVELRFTHDTAVENGGGTGGLRLEASTPMQFLERFLEDRRPDEEDGELWTEVKRLAAACLEKAVQEDEA